MYKYKLLFLLCFFSVSCTVGPDYQRPQFYDEATVAQELNLTEDRPLPEKWYRQFADSQLNELIAKGLQNSTEIQIAMTRLKQARASLEINKADYLPQVNLQGGYNYDKSSKNIGMAADSHYYNAGFDASWELDLWGKGRRQTQADTATLKAAEYTLQDIQRSVVAEIAADYINLLQNMENLRISEQNARLQQDILDTVKAKYKNGLSDETAYSEARYLLENTQAQIPMYRAAVAQYKNALAMIIGILPSELEFIKANSRSLLQRNIIADFGVFPLYVVRLRPDVAAAEQKLVAQNAQVGKAVALLYPDISISGLWGYASQSGSKLISSGSQTYHYTPLLSLPLLDWNKLQNNIELQEYIRQEALENYKQTVINAISEIKDAQTQYAENKIAAHRKYIALQNMQTAARLTKQKYENGLTEFSEVASTQQNLLTAQQDYATACAKTLLSFIAFYKAAGAPV